MRPYIAAFSLLTVVKTLLAATSPSFELVAGWNYLPYSFNDKKLERKYLQQNFKNAVLHGVKVDTKGQIYVSTARWKPGVPSTLSRLDRKGGQLVLSPYPSVHENEIGDDGALQSVLGFEIDRNDVMWILDQGHPAGVMHPKPPKLVLWDIRANKRITQYEFPSEITDPKCSFLNDIVVDSDRGYAYITDSGIYCDPLRGGLIVYSRKGNKSRRLLDRHPSVQDSSAFRFKVDGESVLREKPMRTGADGIALAPGGTRLYWTPFSSHDLYSIQTELLRDFSVPEAKIQNSVNHEVTLPSNADGMTADNKGRVYITALERNGIYRYDPASKSLAPFFTHPDLIWPDTLGWDRDGYLYVSSNQLHRFLDEQLTFGSKQSNFRIWKIKTDAQSYQSSTN